MHSIFFFASVVEHHEMPERPQGHLTWNHQANSCPVGAGRVLRMEKEGHTGRWGLERRVHVPMQDLMEG